MCTSVRSTPLGSTLLRPRRGPRLPPPARPCPSHPAAVHIIALQWCIQSSQVSCVNLPPRIVLVDLSAPRHAAQPPRGAPGLQRCLVHLIACSTVRQCETQGAASCGHWAAPRGGHRKEPPRRTCDKMSLRAGEGGAAGSRSRGGGAP